MTLTITKRDGTKEPFNADKINRSIERACAGLLDPIGMTTQIATETQLTLYDGITTDEMDHATINAAVQNIKEDIEYDKVAVRLLLKTVYRRMVGEYNDNVSELKSKHKKQFAAHMSTQIPLGRVGDPDEIAKAVVFLASDDSSFVNGIELFVDGGMAQI